jgi:hypothetical protein
VKDSARLPEMEDAFSLGIMEHDFGKQLKAIRPQWE